MLAHRAFRRRFANSHSGSQFLPHLPSHWYSDILRPHCGQTRLRIDERMRTFNSPGGVSMVIMFEVSPRSGEGQKRGQNDGGMPRGFCALCDAPNWLAAESLHASRAAPSLSMGQAISVATVNRQQKPLTKLVASTPDFCRADTRARNGRACPNSGAVWRIRNSEGAAARPDKVTRQDGALLTRPKGKRKWGNLATQGRKVNNSTIRRAKEQRFCLEGEML